MEETRREMFKSFLKGSISFIKTKHFALLIATATFKLRMMPDYRIPAVILMHQSKQNLKCSIRMKRIFTKWKLCAQPNFRLKTHMTQAMNGP